MELNPLWRAAAPQPPDDDDALTGEAERERAIGQLCHFARHGDVTRLEALVREIESSAPRQLRSLILGFALPDSSSSTSSSSSGPAPTNNYFSETLDPCIPLHAAAEFNRLECLRLLLKHVNERDCDHVDSRGEAPLHLAAKYGNLDCVKLLLEVANANARVPDSKGNSPLHVATKEGELAVMQFLIERDTKLVHEVNYQEELPLHVAARWDKDDCRCIEELLPGKLLEKMKHVDAFVVDVDDVRTKGLKKTLARMLNQRTRSGQTAAHIAAARDRPKALKKLIDAGATYKEGRLVLEEKTALARVFAFLAMILGPLVVVFAYFGNPKRDPNENSDGNPWSKQCEDGVDCANCTYYMGLTLQPNVFLFSGVFLFKLAQWICESQLIPAVDFLLFYTAHTGSACLSGDWEQDVEDDPAPLSLSHSADIEAGGAAGSNKSSSGKGGSTKGSRKGGSRKGGSRKGGDGERESVKIEPLRKTRFERAYMFVFGSDSLGVLADWRRQKYRGVIFNDKRYHGANFALSPQYLFLYLQTLWSIASIGMLLHAACLPQSQNQSDVPGPGAGSGVWMRQDTDASISDSMLSYVNFFGGVVNSSAVNTVFSLFKMLTFDGRFAQITNAYRNLPLGLSTLWPLFISTPALFLLPPLFSHCIPGLFMFGEFFVPLVFVYLLFTRSYVMMLRRTREEDELQQQQQRLASGGQGGEDLGAVVAIGVVGGGGGGPAEGSVKRESSRSCCASCLWCPLDTCLSAGGRGFDCIFRLLCIEDKALRRAVQKHLFWFFLEIFSRFFFIVLFQLTFDYASLSYLHHDSGKYYKAFQRVYKWRSMPLCFLKQIANRLGVVIVCSFF